MGQACCRGRRGCARSVAKVEEEEEHQGGGGGHHASTEEPPHMGSRATLARPLGSRRCVTSGGVSTARVAGDVQSRRH